MEYRQLSDVKEGAEYRSQVAYHHGVAYSSGSPAQSVVGMDRLDVRGEMVGVDHEIDLSGEMTLNPAREATMNNVNDVPSDSASTESSNFEFVSAQGIPQPQQHGPSACSSVSSCCSFFSTGLTSPNVPTTTHHSMRLITNPDVPNHPASKISQAERSERGTRDSLDLIPSPSSGQVFPAHSDTHQMGKLSVQTGKGFHPASSSVSVVWCHEAIAEANRNLLQCAEHPQVSTCRKDSHFQGKLPCTERIGGQIEKEHGSFLPELEKMSSKMKMPRYDFHPYGEPKVHKEYSSDASYVRNQWKSSNTSHKNANVSINQTSYERKEYRSSPEPKCQLNEQQCQSTEENQYFEELHDAIKRSSWNENLTALVLGNQRLLSQIARERDKGVFSNTSTQVYPGLKSNEQNYIAPTQSLTDTGCLLVKPVGHTSLGQAQLPPCLTPHGDTLGPATRSEENHNYSLVNMNSLHFTGQPPHLHENIVFPQLTKASPPLLQVPMEIAQPLGPFVPVRSLAPIQNYNLVNQLSPFFDNRHRPLMGLQCPTFEFPAPGECPGDQLMLQSMFSRAMQPKPSPLGFALDNATAVQASQRMSYQAPLVSSGYQVTPYPDVYNMFRAANLLSPYHTNPPANSGDKTSSDEAAVDASKASDIQEGMSQEDDIEITDDVTPKKDFHTVRHRPRAKAPRKRQTHECSLCQKTYSRASALKIHMRVHTGERPFICDICNRSFAQAGGLESHRRSHTGERPFRCDVCGRNFSHSTAVRNHMRTHTGEKPYACDLGCGKRFADQSTLKKHRRIHTGEKPFSCPQCGRMFSQLGNMNKHVRCRHDEKAES